MRSAISFGFVAGLLLATAANAASADEWFTYGGVDYQYVSPSYKNGLGVAMPSIPEGANFHIGERFGQYYAVELGYMGGIGQKDGVLPGSDGVLKTSDDIPWSSKVSLSGPTFDVYGYMPLFHGPVSLLGTVGASYLRGSTTISVNGFEVKGAKSELGYRVGGGVEWRPQDRLGVRALVRFQSADFDGMASRSIIAVVGCNFYL
jgi:opacity protein-like surface antigen